MIFPDWETQTQTEETAQSLPELVEWAVDPETGQLKQDETGCAYLVRGAQALRVWVWNALKTERFGYSAHTSAFGAEFSRLKAETSADRELIQSIAALLIRQALLVSPYIEAVERSRFSWSGSRMRTGFTLRTVYDSWEEELELE